ncbi:MULTISPECIES: SHOCT domain-containing protein [unclassified Streptomyces]|uniref:SHOCT domain-containing protein n=1 Tax=unclassified Streptomyces TaxID=2593676 RepID=UPI0037FA44F1
MGLFKSKNQQPADSAPSPLAEYKVTYKGGLPELPKAKVGGIELRFWPDRVTFESTTASKKFWQPLTVPYVRITDLQIVRRQVTTAEVLLSAGSRSGTRDLEQDNNIHLSYTTEQGQPFALRVEMLTGVTVTGQAKKCRELEDMLRVNGIRDRFVGSPVQTAQPAGGGIAEEIGRLATLHAQGVLSDEEFTAAKAQLLGQ